MTRVLEEMAAPDRPGSAGAVRSWAPVLLVALLALPWAGLRLLSGTPEPLPAALLAGLAILGAAFLLAWSAEALQLDVSQALALGLLALVAVLPEYAVDGVFAWKAAGDPTYAGYPVANMTGANRLLIGVGWTAIVLVGWLRHGIHTVRLGRDNALELAVLLAATLYAFTIPLKGMLSLLDAVILGALFILYACAASRAPAETPHLVGPARTIGRLCPRRRRMVVGVLMLYAAAVVLVSAESFARGLVETGLSLGVDEFLLVQWLAPVASESPEFIVAILFAWRAQPVAGLRTIVSSTINQWTLLVATLPLVYSVALGSPAALPLDGRQSQELLLTAAQSLFAVILVTKLTLTRWEALVLFGLFAAQFVVPTEMARLAVAILYLLLSVLFSLWRRQVRRGLVALPSLVRLALRGSAEANRRQAENGKAAGSRLEKDGFVRSAGRKPTISDRPGS